MIQFNKFFPQFKFFKLTLALDWLIWLCFFSGLFLNIYLFFKNRYSFKNAALFIYKTLKLAKEKFNKQSAKKITERVVKEFTKYPLLELEYFIIADVKTLKEIKRKSSKKVYRAFIAVYADGIRLIDNIALN